MYVIMIVLLQCSEANCCVNEMSSWSIVWPVVSEHFVPLATRAKASTMVAVLQKLTSSYLLVKLYVWRHHTAVKAAWPCNGAHE